MSERVQDNEFEKILIRRGPTPECFSEWLLYQYSTDVLSPSEKEKTVNHLRSCQSCRVRIEKYLDEASQAFVPRRKKKSVLFINYSPKLAFGFASATALAAAVILMVLPKERPAFEDGRIKGNNQINLEFKKVDVSEDNGFIPLHSGHSFASGERIRLRIVAPSGHFVALQGLEEDVWVTYYQGVLPTGGNLSEVLVLSDDAKTELRLFACSDSKSLQSVLSPPVSEGSSETKCTKKIFSLHVR